MSVDYPPSLPPPGDRDFLLQAAPDQSIGSTGFTPRNVRKSIRRNEIFGFLRANDIPPDSDIWYWDGEGADEDNFIRIYHRRGSEGAREARAGNQIAQFMASVDPEEAEEGQVLILIGEDRVLSLSKDGKPEQVALEVCEGTIDWRSAKSPGGDYDDHAIFSALTAGFLSNEKRFRKAFEQADQGDYEGALTEIANAFAGATPGATQGTNVLHSLPSVMNDIKKLREVCEDNISQEDADGFSGTGGDMVTGAGVVDNTWQACASLLTFCLDCYGADKVRRMKDKGQRADHFGGNAKSAAAGNISSSMIKTGSGVVKAFDAIKCCNAAYSTAAGVAFAGAGLAGLAGAVATVRGVHQTRKAHKRYRALRALHRLEGAPKYSGTDRSVKFAEGTQRLVAYGMHKAYRKRNFKAVETGVAGTGTVGATVLAIGAFAAGNAWNPIGWGIGIAAFAAGAGLLTYKIARRVSSKRRAKEIGFTRKQFPRELVQRYLYVKRKDGNSANDHHNERRSYELATLEAMLLAYGVEPWRCFYPVEIPHLEARILRHLA